MDVIDIMIGISIIVLLVENIRVEIERRKKK